MSFMQNISKILSLINIDDSLVIFLSFTHFSPFSNPSGFKKSQARIRILEIIAAIMQVFGNSSRELCKSSYFERTYKSQAKLVKVRTYEESPVLSLCFSYSF